MDLYWEDSPSLEVTRPSERVRMLEDRLIFAMSRGKMIDIMRARAAPSSRRDSKERDVGIYRCMQTACFLPRRSLHSDCE